jgi:cystathionine beta-lyase
MILDTYTDLGDGVCFFTPVYHEFRAKTEKGERRPVEIPMARDGDRYVLDFDAAEAMRWTFREGPDLLRAAEPLGPRLDRRGTRAVAEFAARHDLIVISDEIHSDLIYPGAKHVPMMLAAPEHADRIITINAASKTFGIPGLRTGYAIIPDPDLRAAYQRRMRMTEYGPGTPGIAATKAAYSPEGAAWVEELVTYLDGNRKVFDEGINAIPGSGPCRCNRPSSAGSISRAPA